MVPGTHDHGLPIGYVGKPKTAESTFPALSAVLSVPIRGDVVKYSMSLDGMGWGLVNRELKVVWVIFQLMIRNLGICVPISQNPPSIFIEMVG